VGCRLKIVSSYVKKSIVAAKIPEGVIREMLSEVRADGARSPAKLFTYKIKQYALERARKKFREDKKGLFPSLEG
jgi:hypothetical protein